MFQNFFPFLDHKLAVALITRMVPGRLAIGKIEVIDITSDILAADRERESAQGATAQGDPSQEELKAPKDSEKEHARTYHGGGVSVCDCGAQTPVLLHPFWENQGASHGLPTKERSALSFASGNYTIHGTWWKTRASPPHPKPAVQSNLLPRQEGFWGPAGGGAGPLRRFLGPADTAVSTGSPERLRPPGLASLLSLQPG